MNMKRPLFLFLLLFAAMGCVPLVEEPDETPPSRETATVAPTEAPPSPTATSLIILPTVAPTATAVFPTPPAEQPPTRIQLEPGSETTTLNGRLQAGQTISYIAQASAAQRFALSLTSANQIANFSVTGTADGQPYKRLVNENRTWEQILTSSQDYLIRVHTLEDTNYSLTLTITTPPESLQPVWPIIDAESGQILGGSHNGAWLNRDTVMTALQDSERLYRLSGQEGERGHVTGSLPFVPLGPCPFPTVTLSPASDQLQNGIATLARWDLQPRPATPFPLDTAVYVDQVRTLLQQNGLPDPNINLTAVYRLDLEGDGVDEAIIFAENLTGLAQGLPIANAGDYSLVMLNRIVDGEVQHLPLKLDYFTQSAELVYPLHHAPLGFWDLNGDGQLEIVMEGVGYERRTVEIYASQPGGIAQVLGGGCPA